MMLDRSRLAIILLTVCAAAQAQVADRHSDLLRYQGSYRFPDGTIITGGRMDEAGRVMLSYLDTHGVSRGGVFDASGDEFTGLYGTQASIEFADDGDVMIWQARGEDPLRLERIMKPEARPASFTSGDVRLAGTLYLPPGTNRALPAVVLAHGSGPTNRYLGPWVTFFVAEGYGVLAFDKRGTGASGGDWQRSTYLDLAADVVAAGEWLAGQALIDAARIGLKTSSQSGWYGPHAVESSGVYEFLIQRAAPAVNIGTGTAHEIRCELEAEGLAPGDIDAAVEFWLDLHEMARSGASLASANEYLRKVRFEDWFAPSFGDWDTITPLWWHQHTVNMQLEPAATTAGLEVPVLWFLAENDENVPYRESMDALESAREANADLTVVTVHDAGHSFFVSDGGEGLRYTDEYWARMAGWLNEHVAAGPARHGMDLRPGPGAGGK